MGRQARQLDLAAVVDRQQPQLDVEQPEPETEQARAAADIHMRAMAGVAGRHERVGALVHQQAEDRNQDDPEDERTHHSHVQMVGRRARVLTTTNRIATHGLTVITYICPL